MAGPKMSKNGRLNGKLELARSEPEARKLTMASI